MLSNYSIQPLISLFVMFDKEIILLAEDILKTAKEKNYKIATAESCTAGLISCAITHISGSSDVFERGYITYSNESKCENLNINPELINKFGAVSRNVAEKMAEGVIFNSNANLGLSITGIAGPKGGTDDKPVGLVFIAIHNKKTGESNSFKNLFEGNREEIRKLCLQKSLEALLEEINEN